MLTNGDKWAHSGINFQSWGFKKCSQMLTNVYKYHQMLTNDENNDILTNSNKCDQMLGNCNKS